MMARNSFPNETFTEATRQTLTTRLAARACWIATLLFWCDASYAFDSYRYLHVTIETPWAIFLFLLPIVMSPLILMAFLYWRFARRRAQLPKNPDTVVAEDKKA